MAGHIEPVERTPQGDFQAISFLLDEEMGLKLNGRLLVRIHTEQGGQVKEEWAYIEKPRSVWDRIVLCLTPNVHVMSRLDISREVNDHLRSIASVDRGFDCLTLKDQAVLAKNLEKLDRRFMGKKEDSLARRFVESIGFSTASYDTQVREQLTEAKEFLPPEWLESVKANWIVSRFRDLVRGNQEQDRIEWEVPGAGVQVPSIDFLRDSNLSAFLQGSGNNSNALAPYLRAGVLHEEWDGQIFLTEDLTFCPKRRGVGSLRTWWQEGNNLRSYRVAEMLAEALCHATYEGWKQQDYAQAKRNIDILRGHFIRPENRGTPRATWICAALDIALQVLTEKEQTVGYADAAPQEGGGFFSNLLGNKDSKANRGKGALNPSTEAVRMDMYRQIEEADLAAKRHEGKRRLKILEATLGTAQADLQNMTEQRKQLLAVEKIEHKEADCLFDEIGVLMFNTTPEERGRQQHEEKLRELGRHISERTSQVRRLEEEINSLRRELGLPLYAEGTSSSDLDTRVALEQLKPFKGDSQKCPKLNSVSVDTNRGADEIEIVVEEDEIDRNPGEGAGISDEDLRSVISSNRSTNESQPSKDNLGSSDEASVPYKGVGAIGSFASGFEDLIMGNSSEQAPTMSSSPFWSSWFDSTSASDAEGKEKVVPLDESQLAQTFGPNQEQDIVKRTQGYAAAAEKKAESEQATNTQSVEEESSFFSNFSLPSIASFWGEMKEQLEAVETPHTPANKSSFDWSEQYDAHEENEDVTVVDETSHSDREEGTPPPSEEELKLAQTMDQVSQYRATASQGGLSLYDIMNEKGFNQ